MVGNPGTPSAEDSDLPDPFEIVSIRAVEAPPGTGGSDWYRYEISQGENRIVGYRMGAARRVREAVELIVVGLNMRRTHRRGRVHVILNPKTSRRVQ
jgi:hypothetical protein